MKIVDAHLLEEKMDEVVTHYINSHPPGEPVHVDGGPMSLNVQDDVGRVVTVMSGHGYSSQMSRHVPVSEVVETGPWNEELMDPEMRLAALVAHLAHQSRASHHQTSSVHSKISSMRDVDSETVILDSSLKIFNGQPLDSQSDSIVVQVPPLPPLPPLQGICSRKNTDTNWYHPKDKNSLKANGELLGESESTMIELSAGASPAHIKQNKKSLPHKKRISRKLKRNGNCTPQQDIVVINCTDEVPAEEILPDNFVAAVQHQEHLTEETHHIAHEVRPVLICQVCGDFYGEEQLKFYQHLKQHYEPHAGIVIENPVQHLAIDKMDSSCIVDSGATLPDSIVELSLESTVPKTVYQPIDKHILYSSGDKAIYTNRVQYAMASMEKEPVVVTSEAEKADIIYDTLDKLDLYSCVKCNKQFRKQKQCEAHIREAHSTSKLEDMGEFSEPEDLMEGIHVAVPETGSAGSGGEGGEGGEYEHTLLPTLTVDNGTVHQGHARHWYLRSGSGGGACGADGAYCPVCPGAGQHAQLKEEVLQRIFDSEVTSDQPDHFPDHIIHEQEIPAEPEPEPEADPDPELNTGQQQVKSEPGKKKAKKFECLHCDRVFQHRNSLLYHILSHREKQYKCVECGKGFYTTNALKVHMRLHSGDRPYKCDECGREFRQWSDLKYHKISLHTTQKHFKCEYCGKEFARKYSLNVHRRIHTGERNYKCYYCTKTFRASSYRTSHMRTHTGDRPYKCPICEKAFRVSADLRRHMLIHERVRCRNEELKKPKEDKPKKNQHKTEPILEPKEEQTPPKVKKIAVASTTRLPVQKNVDKKPRPRKAAVKKVGAPNVTVMQSANREQFKIYTATTEVFDTRQEYGKFKEVYSDTSTEYNKPKDYNEQIISYKGSEHDRELATLKPIYRDSVETVNDKPIVYSRVENTDGKMQVYTHVEKSALVANSIGDIRVLERDRGDLHGESIENGFLENLTALYNIPAV